MNEKENTIRILRDETLLVTSFWCKFKIHKWTKWNKATTKSDVFGKTFIFQERTCASCGRLEISKRRYP